MALTPAKMKRVDMVLLDRDVPDVTRLLGHLGVLHLVEVRPEDTAAQVVRWNRSEDLERCRSLAARLDALRDRLGLRELSSAPGDSYDSLAVVEQDVAALEARVQPLIENRARLEAESEGLQDELTRLEALGVFSVPVERLLESPFLHFVIGSVKAGDMARLAEEARGNILLMDLPGTSERRRLVAVTSRKGRFAMESLLRKHSVSREDLSQAPRGLPTEIIAGLHQRIDAIREEHRRIQRDLQQTARSAAPRVAAMMERLRIEETLLRASMNFGLTSSTCVISGWLPEESLSEVSVRLVEKTGGRLILQVREPEETGIAPEDVPVLMKNPSWIRPFEMLVRGFGFPRYKEVEPTLLVAVTFLIMYGLMFGDVGHGGVLALIGWGIWHFGRTAQMKDLGVIVAFAGVAAGLCGFLYGSIFGIEHWLPFYWAHPLEHQDMMKVLTLPILLGIVIISIGVVINIVNHFRTGKYFHALIDRFGVIGIIFYWGAIGLGARYVLTRDVSALGIVLLVIIPLAVLFFRELIISLLFHRGHGGEGGLSTLMHGGVEVMEAVSSYLANTVSFARVGAFALAHAGLVFATFSLERSVSAFPGGAVWGVLVLIFGNALIIGLEGLIVFVQCLRLEYYEFFGKFFEGGGKQYNPFRIG